MPSTLEYKKKKNFSLDIQIKKNRRGQSQKLGNKEKNRFSRHLASKLQKIYKLE